MLPDEREQILRLTLRDQSSSSTVTTPGKDRIVLFQGDRGVVLRTVRVTPYDFRLAFAPWLEWLFETYSLILHYTFTLSLAMAIFNMLPLPSLDGDIFLLVILNIISQRVDSRNSPRQTPARSSTQRHRNILEQIHTGRVGKVRNNQNRTFLASASATT